MFRKLIAAVLFAAFATVVSLSPVQGATTAEQEKILVLKKKKLLAAKNAATAKKAAEKRLLAARKKIDDLQKLKRKKVVVAKVDDRKRLVSGRVCKGFMQCLFGTRRGVRVTQSGVQTASLAGAGLSGRTTRSTVDWDNGKYPVGSLVVKTPERALYLIKGNGEAIRYSIGVGKEGFQWGGSSTIGRKAEWPSWTPPKVMIEREAAKGHIIPPFMEGGPGNPLGARALYINGTIFRVHGTNNEASIGGAVSSGCIRMMNADVIDLYDRVKVGTKIYVIQ